jgi:hypothetical protein
VQLDELRQRRNDEALVAVDVALGALPWIRPSVTPE